MSDNIPPQPADASATPPPAAPAYPQTPAYPQAPAYQPPADYAAAPPAPPAYGASYAPPAGYEAPPAYPQQPYGYGAYAPAAKTNGLAITSLIASIANFVVLPFIGAIVGVITGHIALKQLRTSGEAGRGMALAGTIVGWVGVGFSVIGIVLIILWMVLVFGAVGYSSYSYTT